MTTNPISSPFLQVINIGRHIEQAQLYSTTLCVENCRRQYECMYKDHLKIFKYFKIYFTAAPILLEQLGINILKPKYLRQLEAQISWLKSISYITNQESEK